MPTKPTGFSRMMPIVWRFGILLAFVVALAAGYYTGQVSAATKLVTPDEVNNVEVYSKSINAVVTVIAKLSPEATPQGEDPTGYSSGFFVRPNLVVTNYHAIEGATEAVSVRLRNGRSLPATIFAVDEGIDIAMLQVQGYQSPNVLKFGQSKALTPGQKVIVMGSPSGKPNNISVGVVGSFNRIDEFQDDIGTEIPEMLITDATILQGNSGGPMLDSKGLIVGVVDAQLSTATSVGGILGLAIPGDLVIQSVSDLEKFGVSQRGQLGAKLQDVKELETIILRQSGLKSSQGAMVRELEQGKAANKAGLRPARYDRDGKLETLGDIILAVDGKTIEDRFRVTQEIAKKRPGQNVALKIWRNRQPVNLTLTIVARTQ